MNNGSAECIVDFSKEETLSRINGAFSTHGIARNFGRERLTNCTHGIGLVAGFFIRATDLFG